MAVSIKLEIEAKGFKGAASDAEDAQTRIHTAIKKIVDDIERIQNAFNGINTGTAQSSVRAFQNVVSTQMREVRLEIAQTITQFEALAAEIAKVGTVAALAPSGVPTRGAGPAQRAQNIVRPTLANVPSPVDPNAIITAQGLSKALNTITPAAQSAAKAVGALGLSSADLAVLAARAATGVGGAEFAMRSIVGTAKLADNAFDALGNRLELDLLRGLTLSAQAAAANAIAFKDMMRVAKQEAGAVKNLAAVQNAAAAAQRGVIAGLDSAQFATARFKSAVDAANKGLGPFNGNLSSLKQALIVLTGPFSGIGTRLGAFTSLIKSAGAQMAIFAAAIIGIGVAVAKSIANFGRFQGELLQIGKVTGDTDFALNRLGESLLALSTRLGIPSKAINEIAVTAAQLGIEGADNIVRFTETIAQLSRVADNLDPRVAAQQMAVLINVTGTGVDKVGKLADVIFALGRSTVATEKDVLEFGTAVSKVGGVFGVTATQALAVGATLKSIGVRAEAGATAVQRVFALINKASFVGGDSLKRLAGFANLTSEEFRKLAKQDIGQAFVKTIQGINQLAKAGANVGGILEGLGLTALREQKSLLPLINNTELLTDAFTTAGEAVDSNSSLIVQAFDRISQGFPRQIERLGTSLSNIFTNLGESAINPVNIILGLLNEVFSHVEGVTAVIKTLIVAFTALGAVAFVMSGGLTAVIAGLGAAATAAVTMGGSVTFAVGAFTLLGSAILANIGTIAKWLSGVDEIFDATQKIKQGADAVAEGLKSANQLLGIINKVGASGTLREEILAVSDATAKLVETQGQDVDAINRHNSALELLKRGMRALNLETEDLNKAFIKAEVAVNKIIRQYFAAKNALDAFNQGSIQTAEQEKAIGQAAEFHAKSLQTLSIAEKEALTARIERALASDSIVEAEAALAEASGASVSASKEEREADQKLLGVTAELFAATNSYTDSLKLQHQARLALTETIRDQNQATEDALARERALHEGGLEELKRLEQLQKAREQLNKTVPEKLREQVTSTGAAVIPEVQDLPQTDVVLNISQVGAEDVAKSFDQIKLSTSGVITASQEINQSFATTEKQTNQSTVANRGLIGGLADLASTLAKNIFSVDLYGQAFTRLEDSQAKQAATQEAADARLKQSAAAYGKLRESLLSIDARYVGARTSLQEFIAVLEFERDELLKRGDAEQAAFKTTQIEAYRAKADELTKTLSDQTKISRLVSQETQLYKNSISETGGVISDNTARIQGLQNAYKRLIDDGLDPGSKAAFELQDALLKTRIASGEFTRDLSDQVNIQQLANDAGGETAQTFQILARVAEAVKIKLNSQAEAVKKLKELYPELADAVRGLNLELQKAKDVAELRASFESLHPAIATATTDFEQQRAALEALRDQQERSGKIEAAEDTSGRIANLAAEHKELEKTFATSGAAATLFNAHLDKIKTTAAANGAALSDNEAKVRALAATYQGAVSVLRIAHQTTQELQAQYVAAGIAAGTFVRAQTDQIAVLKEVAANGTVAGQTMQDLGAIAKELEIDTGSLAGNVQALSEKYPELAENVRLANEELARTEIMAQYSQSLREISAAQDFWAQTSGQTASNVEVLTRSVETQRQKVDAAFQAWRAHAQALGENHAATLAMRDAALAAADALAIEEQALRNATEAAEQQAAAAAKHARRHQGFELGLDISAAQQIIAEGDPASEIDNLRAQLAALEGQLKALQSGFSNMFGGGVYKEQARVVAQAIGLITQKINELTLAQSRTAQEARAASAAIAGVANAASVWNSQVRGSSSSMTIEVKASGSPTKSFSDYFGKDGYAAQKINELIDSVKNPVDIPVETAQAKDVKPIADTLKNIVDLTNQIGAATGSATKKMREAVKTSDEFRAAAREHNDRFEPGQGVTKLQAAIDNARALLKAQQAAKAAAEQTVAAIDDVTAATKSSTQATRDAIKTYRDYTFDASKQANSPVGANVTASVLMPDFTKYFANLPSMIDRALGSIDASITIPIRTDGLDSIRAKLDSILRPSLIPLRAPTQSTGDTTSRNRDRDTLRTTKIEALLNKLLNETTHNTEILEKSRVENNELIAADINATHRVADAVSGDKFTSNVQGKLERKIRAEGDRKFQFNRLKRDRIA